MTNNNKPQIDLPVWEWLRFAPTSTSPLTALTTARDGIERFIYYFNNQQLYRYDTYADTWQMLSTVNVAPITALSVQYVKNQGFVGNVLSVPSSTSIQIPSTNNPSLAGYKVRIQSGAGAGQERTIVSANPEVIHEQGTVTSVTTSIVGDTTRRWKQNQWVGYGLKLIYGAGFSQFREILYNDTASATVYDSSYEGRVSSSTPYSINPPYSTPTITAGFQTMFAITSQIINVDSPWTITPDATSTFEILSGGIWWLSSNASTSFFNFNFYDILSDRFIQKLTPTGLILNQLSTDFTIEPMSDNLLGSLIASTATSGTTKTITDTSLIMSKGNYNNYYVSITGGTGMGQKRRITSNTVNKFSVTPKWDIVPNGTSKYRVTVKEDIFLTGNGKAQMLKYYPTAGVWTTGNKCDDGIISNLAVLRTNRLPHGVSSIQRTNNGIRTINPIPTAGGTNYIVGDILIVSTGSGTGRVYVEEINPVNGAVTRISLYQAGSNYIIGAGNATTGGAGAGCTVEITALGIIGAITTVLNNDIKIGDALTIAGESDNAWNHTYNVIGYIGLTTIEVLITDMPLFHPLGGFGSSVYIITVQPDGKILVGGTFSTYQSITANKIIRLNLDGSIDNTFVVGTGFDAAVYSIIVQSDGKILVGGSFTTYQGSSASRIIRLNSDGSKDTSFIMGTGFSGGSIVLSMLVQPDGKILAGGSFTTYQGVAANFIIRLNADGSKDTSFVMGTGFNTNPNSIALQSNGKILVVGNFVNYQGVSANYIIRLNADGSKDTSFVFGTGFNSAALSTVIQPDGKILVAGTFITYNGTGANKIIRLNTDGTIDNTFVYGTGLNGNIQQLVLQSNNKILAVGQFNTYQGILTSSVARLNTDGSKDVSLVTGSGFNAGANTMALQSDGNILIGGTSSIYNNQQTNYLTQLSSGGTYVTYAPAPLNTLATLVQDVSKSWTPNEFAGKILGIQANGITGIIVFRRIMGNSSNTISCINGIATTNGNSRYFIQDLEAFGKDTSYLADNQLNSGYVTSSLGIVEDTTKSWYSAAYNNNKVRLLNTDTGEDFEDIITSSTPTTLNLGRMVGVGTGAATLSISNDNGLTWNSNATPFTTAAFGVAWSGTRFVAVGEGTNTIAYSNDGNTWTGLGVGTFSTRGKSVCWNGTRFVAVGSGTNNIAFSNDGITWTGLGASAFSVQGNGVAWNGTYFIAVGEGTTNSIAYSNDGITWTGLGTSIFSTRGNGVAYGGGKFIATGEGATNTLAHSSDGIIWTNDGKTTFSTAGYNAVWNGTRYVAVGAGTNSIAYGSDGISWTGLSTSIFSAQGYGVCWNGTRFIATGTGTNAMAYSSDGINWTGLGLTVGSLGTGYGAASTTPFASVTPSIGLIPNSSTKYDIQDTFGSTSGSLGTTQLQDMNKKWKINQWAGKRLLITSGLGVGQEIQIVSNTVNALSYAAVSAVDLTSTYTILGRPNISAGISLMWNFGATKDKGKYLFSHRGNGWHILDIYDTTTNRWNYGIFTLGQGEILGSGTMYAYDGKDRIYYHVTTTGKILYYDISKNEICSMGTIPTAMGTAILSNRMEIIQTADGLKYLYIMKHSGQEFWRMLINY